MFTKENALRVVNVKHGKNEKSDFVFLSPYKKILNHKYLKFQRLEVIFTHRKYSVWMKYLFLPSKISFYGAYMLRMYRILCSDILKKKKKTLQFPSETCNLNYSDRSV